MAAVRYCVKHISEELIISNACRSLILHALFDVDTSVVYKGVSGTFKSHVMSQVEPESFDEILSFLKQYEKYIKNACDSRSFCLGNEYEDCVQFIKVHLVRAYYKKHMYTNWDRVVRSIIKRKVIDFIKFKNNGIGNIINETDYIASLNIDGDVNVDCFELYSDEKNFYDSSSVCFDYAKLFRKIKADIYDNDAFTENERMVIDYICEHVYDGNFDFDEIVKSANSECPEFCYCWGGLVQKIRRYFDKDKYIGEK